VALEDQLGHRGGRGRANSTTAVWSSRASTTGSPARPPATPWLSAAAPWSATTSSVIPQPNTGSEAAAAIERRARPGEAVFAPAVGQSDELAGWYLTYVYDPVTDGSDLVVIDASDFEGDPVARIRLPRRVPHGFHGNWIPRLSETMLQYCPDELERRGSRITYQEVIE